MVLIFRFLLNAESGRDKSRLESRPIIQNKTVNINFEETLSMIIFGISFYGLKTVKLPHFIKIIRANGNFLVFFAVLFELLIKAFQTGALSRKRHLRFIIIFTFFQQLT